MRHAHWFETLGALSSVAVGYLVAGVLSGDLLAAGPAKTVPPPNFNSPEHKAAANIFFPDARQKLGPGQPGAVQVVPAGTPGANPSGGSGDTGDLSWSAIISPEMLEAEIKSQQKALATSVANLNGFKSGGNTASRNSFSILTSLFKVVGEYSGEVRFKKESLALSKACSQAASNCKTSSDNAYKEAKMRSDGLKDLLNGQPPSDLPKPDPDAKWSDLVDLPPLMQRLELSEKERLAALGGSKSDFDKHLDELRQEGEVVALVGKVLQAEGMENADQADFKGWAQQLQAGGHDLADAAKNKDHDKATKAISQIKKACTDCHGAYR